MPRLTFISPRLSRQNIRKGKINTLLKKIGMLTSEEIFYIIDSLTQNLVYWFCDDLMWLMKNHAQPTHKPKIEKIIPSTKSARKNTRRGKITHN